MKTLILVVVLLMIILTGCKVDPARSPSTEPTTTEQPTTIIRTDFPNGGY